MFGEFRDMTEFKNIRRRERALTEEQAREILARAEHGVLATVGADGWPYAVAVNHVLSGDVLYIHCAMQGHKLENISHEARVCFCAVASAKVMPADLYHPLRERRGIRPGGSGDGSRGETPGSRGAGRPLLWRRYARGGRRNRHYRLPDRHRAH